MRGLFPQCTFFVFYSQERATATLRILSPPPPDPWTIYAHAPKVGGMRGEASGHWGGTKEEKERKGRQHEGMPPRNEGACRGVREEKKVLSLIYIRCNT